RLTTDDRRPTTDDRRPTTDDWKLAITEQWARWIENKAPRRQALTIAFPRPNGVRKPSSGKIQSFAVRSIE
ncbi:hypothetical protein, partial [Burkholderia thailandensis]|uniref:hypothetical protein n=1 Tax=Burkholderia thailandensis TaxID=57975 RepID=UPI0021C6D48E